MDILMKPLVFIDSYWFSHRTATLELHKFAISLAIDEFRQLAALLNLELTMHGKNTYYIVPATISLKQFKEANKIVQWHKMPKQLPRTKLTGNKVNPRFRTVYEYEHFIFADVHYSKVVTGGYELSPNDARRIYAILEQMKRVPYARLHDYLLENRETYPHRNGKIVIPRHVDIEVFRSLAERHKNKRNVPLNDPKPQPSVPRTQPQRDDRTSGDKFAIQETTGREPTLTRSSGPVQTALIGNPHRDATFRPTEVAPTLKREIPLRAKPSGKLIPSRVTNAVTRIVRTSAPVAYLKKLYADACQICGQKVDLGQGRGYSEVHHIQPLGKHRGADITQNMIVVCPNHHVMFDRGVITIDVKSGHVTHVNPLNEWNGKKLLLKHEISQQYIDYHDRNIYVLSVEALPASSHTAQAIRDGHFGKTMTLTDTSSNEEITVRFEPYLQREFMTALQRAALYRNIGDEIVCGGYSYRVTGLQ